MPRDDINHSPRKKLSVTSVVLLTAGFVSARGEVASNAGIGPQPEPPPVTRITAQDQRPQVAVPVVPLTDGRVITDWLCAGVVKRQWVRQGKTDERPPRSRSGER